MKLKLKCTYIIISTIKFQSIFCRGSEEESDDEFLIEAVEKKDEVAETDFGLNEEIFGFLLKMKEKERLKLVKHF